MGKRSRLWDDLSSADLELPVALPPNIAVVLQEPSRDEPDTLPQRAAEFFGERTGGPYGVWSLWPLEGLPPNPLDLWHIPIMVRDAGGNAPVAAAGLEIIEATDASTVREAAALIDESFEAQSEPEAVLTLNCLDDDFRVWVGRVDGRAVTTATAYIADGFVGLRRRHDTGCTRTRIWRGRHVGRHALSAGASGNTSGESDGTTDLRTHGVPNNRRVYGVGSRTLMEQRRPDARDVARRSRHRRRRAKRDDVGPR
jgi:hypothetical protein